MPTCRLWPFKLGETEPVPVKLTVRDAICTYSKLALTIAESFPLVSVAMALITFGPGSRPTVAFQLEVPAAIVQALSLIWYRTSCSPKSSLAVPLMLSVAVVILAALAGDWMVSVGGFESKMVKWPH